MSLLSKLQRGVTTRSVNEAYTTGFWKNDMLTEGDQVNLAKRFAEKCKPRQAPTYKFLQATFTLCWPGFALRLFFGHPRHRERGGELGVSYECN